ncbi:MAG: hypothetical protein HYT98_01305 [Candidatus Sungbacteria bacterium]|nr:hypothetical protein [Candidatus Sungbacteria bacterium]
MYKGQIAPIPNGEDNRRIIEEFNCTEGGFSVGRFFIKNDDKALGNHYHRDKEETFVILDGSGIVVTQKLLTSGNPLGPVERTELQPDSVVKIMRYTAHAFLLKPGSRMICYSSAAFNLENQDLIPYIVIP